MASPYISKYCVDTGTYTPPGVNNVGSQLSGGYNCTYGTSGVRFLNVSDNAAEINLFSGWWKEQISQYGQQINYYINGYNLSAHDFLYGEHTLLRYAPAIPMVMAIQLSNDNVVLSKFGLQGEADLTAWISITTFSTTVTAISGSLSAQNYEPKAGDLIELAEYGSTRPGGRSGKVFEITERLDESGSEEANQIMGHYIWTIKAKRYEWNYELSAPREKKMDQVYDNKYEGPVNSLPKVLETKEYTQFVDKAATNVFNYTDYAASDTNVYGEYQDTNVLVNLIGATNRAGITTGAVTVSGGTAYLVANSPNN